MRRRSRNRASSSSATPTSQQGNGTISLKKQLLLCLLGPSIMFGIVNHWVAQWAAYLISSLPVLYVLFIEFKENGSPGMLTVPILIGIIVQAILAGIFPGNARIVNISRAVVPFIIGCLFLVSIVALPENLITMFVHKSQAAARAKAEAEGPDALANYELEQARIRRNPERFRFVTTLLCLVWGIGNLVIVAVILLIDFLAPASANQWATVGVSIGGQIVLAGISYLVSSYYKAVGKKAREQEEAAAAAAVGGGGFAVA
ncbi:hypothetical protein HDU98_010987 [Podochytrium sp. JEL0797]|nr:hypothetical protein HDU98_010987 [Podochytrium sp. JEL0797]